MRTHTTAALLAITGLLALPAGVSAGGWAMVQLSSTPDGVAAGKPWDVDISVLQHGFRPLDGVHPTVTIASADGSLRRTFTTRPAGRAGVHRASVTFPRAGTWRYTIDDGFTMRHPYPPVQIGDGAGAAAGASGQRDGGGGLALDRLGLAGLAGLLAAGVALTPARLRARRTEHPAAAAGT
ncbi:MAG: hypothetical protein Q8K79_17490 [Solirubrobacteraceae bacterium]|nr:hypothetical protein [Solirubrobacteraceae bacterium]